MIVVPKERWSLFTFSKGDRIWRGRERNWSMGACPLWNSSRFSQFSFLFFLFSFLSFSFGSCSVAFFHSKMCSVFDPSPFFLLQGTARAFFIEPAVASVLRSCPLTAFVWSGCTYQPHYATPTLARQRQTCFIPLYVVVFLPAMTLMPSLSTLRACTQRFPLKLPLLGGLSSQQDVPPKRGLGRSRK